MARAPGLDDAEAVSRCLGGDPEAFGVLVRRYRALAVAVAFGICHDRALAEDAAQEAFIQAYRKLAHLEKRGSFCPWLLNILRNIARRAAHNAARRRDVHRQARSKQGPHTENPTANMELAELLGRLDGTAQQVLTMKYIQGMTCREISRQISAPIGTVTSRISRALSTLRQIAEREQTS